MLSCSWNSGQRFAPCGEVLDLVEACPLPEHILAVPCPTRIPLIAADLLGELHALPAHGLGRGHGRAGRENRDQNDLDERLQRQSPRRARRVIGRHASEVKSTPPGEPKRISC